MPRIVRQKRSPSPFSRPMDSSTPFTSQRPNTLPKRMNINAQAASPLQQEIFRNSTTNVKVKQKYYSLWFDVNEAGRFIKMVENIAEFEGESGRDIERKIFVWTKYQEITYNIEGMPRYETGDWEKLMLDMKRKWGTVSPERRFKLSSIAPLFRKIHQEGVIRYMSQDKKFVWECESIINFSKCINIYREISIKIKEVWLVFPQVFDNPFMRK
ncbi:hypothetical protein O181_049809 [Austropuccinia psidii MF-1]|uniref:Uncharacterized protein n=1 Tax=Austropuccinia psidii MF-1 TaxID=1389203 RepID=A0A9Q3DVJ9_9BASI|nr:hypothetical protein [Austropuccinia psidii MF-1]